MEHLNFSLGQCSELESDVYSSSSPIKMLIQSYQLVNNYPNMYLIYNNEIYIYVVYKLMYTHMNIYMHLHVYICM